MLVWQANAWKEYLEWQGIDRSVVKKINELIKECLRTPLKERESPSYCAQTMLGIGRDE